MSKGVFAKQVNKRIMETAHVELLVECNSLTKTSGIQYHEFKTQDYLLKVFPGESRTIFKWGSRTLDVKSHLTYKYKDAICRRCKNADETPDHIINGSDELIAVDDVTELNDLDVEVKNRVKEQVQRIVTFIHEYSKGTCPMDEEIEKTIVEGNKEIREKIKSYLNYNKSELVSLKSDQGYKLNAKLLSSC